jgi:hypothetical protein
MSMLFAGNIVKGGILTSQNSLHHYKMRKTKAKKRNCSSVFQHRWGIPRLQHFICKIRHTLNRACPRHLGASSRLVICRPLKPTFFDFIGLGRDWRQFLSARAQFGDCFWRNYLACETPSLLVPYSPWRLGASCRLAAWVDARFCRPLFRSWLWMRCLLIRWTELNPSPYTTWISHVVICLKNCLRYNDVYIMCGCFRNVRVFFCIVCGCSCKVWLFLLRSGSFCYGVYVFVKVWMFL